MTHRQIIFVLVADSLIVFDRLLGVVLTLVERTEGYASGWFVSHTERFFQQVNGSFIISVGCFGGGRKAPITICQAVRHLRFQGLFQTFAKLAGLRQVLDCTVMARIDFLYDGTLYVNEANTIPGFTPISLYPKLLSLSGISYTTLIDEIIKISLGVAVLYR